MNKQTVGIIFTIIGIVILGVGIYAYTYSTTTLTQTEALPASKSITVPLELGLGDKVQGALTIEGSEGIKVYVEDPANQVTYTGGSVYSNVEFSFTAQSSGTYTVVFENLSPTNQQTIEYSFSYPAISSIVSYSLMAIGAILLIAGIVLAVILNKK